MHNIQNNYKVISYLDEFSFVHTYYDLADETHFWIRWRIRAFLNQIKFLGISTNSPMLALEIGCGNGILRKQIESSTQWIVDGTDLDCQALKENPPCKGTAYAYDIMDRHLDFKEKYDVLFLFDVLEHIEQPVAFLQACLFHLKKDGHIFINVPALQQLFSPYDLANGHYRRYNKRTLVGELLQSKLQIDDVWYWGCSLIGLLFLRKLITSPNQSKEDIIRRGFKPPGKLINSLLCMLMKMETSLIKRPLLGTSVMAVAQKKH